MRADVELLFLLGKSEGARGWIWLNFKRIQVYWSFALFSEGIYVFCRRLWNLFASKYGMKSMYECTKRFSLGWIWLGSEQKLSLHNVRVFFGRPFSTFTRMDESQRASLRKNACKRTNSCTIE